VQPGVLCSPVCWGWGGTFQKGRKVGLAQLRQAGPTLIGLGRQANIRLIPFCHGLWPRTVPIAPAPIVYARGPARSWGG